MDSVKYIGMDVHKEAISIAVLNSSGKLVMESTIETKASTILEFLKGLRGACVSLLKKARGPRGSMTSSSRTSRNWWYAIPAGMLCSPGCFRESHTAC
jgi:hypothetical protein